MARTLEGVTPFGEEDCLRPTFAVGWKNWDYLDANKCMYRKAWIDEYIRAQRFGPFFIQAISFTPRALAQSPPSAANTTEETAADKKSPMEDYARLCYGPDVLTHRRITHTHHSDADGKPKVVRLTANDLVPKLPFFPLYVEQRKVDHLAASGGKACGKGDERCSAETVLYERITKGAEGKILAEIRREKRGIIAAD